MSKFIRKYDTNISDQEFREYPEEKGLGVSPIFGDILGGAAGALFGKFAVGPGIKAINKAWNTKAYDRGLKALNEAERVGLRGHGGLFETTAVDASKKALGDKVEDLTLGATDYVVKKGIDGLPYGTIQNGAKKIYSNSKNRLLRSVNKDAMANSIDKTRKAIKGEYPRAPVEAINEKAKRIINTPSKLAGQVIDIGSTASGTLFGALAGGEIDEQVGLSESMIGDSNKTDNNSTSKFIRQYR